MPNTEFEIPSKEIQEVLYRPTKTLVTWGNTFILMFLLLGIFIIGSIRITRNRKVPFTNLTYSSEILLLSLITDEKLPIYQDSINQNYLRSIVFHNKSGKSSIISINTSSVYHLGNLTFIKTTVSDSSKFKYLLLSPYERIQGTISLSETRTIWQFVQSNKKQ